ncbi:MAG: hypothetical protein JNM85_07890 [Chthonomonas sp.]|nr:hypothetical protein [Chthonomonas sp.]
MTALLLALLMRAEGLQLDGRVETLSMTMPRLAQATGLRLTLDASLGSRLGYLVARDADQDKFLESIALAFDARWAPGTGGARKLVPNPKRLPDAAEEELPPMGTRDALAERVRQMLAQAQVTSLDRLTARNAEKIAAFDPLVRLRERLAKLIDPKEAAPMLPGERAVFAALPNKAQRLFPAGFQEALDKYNSESMAFNDSVAKALADLGAPPLLDPILEDVIPDPIVILTRELGSEPKFTLSIPSFEQRARASVPDSKEIWSETSEEFLSTTFLVREEVSPVMVAFAERAQRSLTQPFAIVEPSAPLEGDPVTQRLGPLFDQVRDNVIDTGVFALGDDFATSVLLLTRPTNAFASRDVGQYGHVLGRSANFDRSLMQRLKTGIAAGKSDLNDWASALYRLERGESEEMLTVELSLAHPGWQGLPALALERGVLATLGALTASQRNQLIAGAPLPARMLGPEAWRTLNTLVYGVPGWIRGREAPFAEVGGEPTFLVPESIPSGAALRLEIERTWRFLPEGNVQGAVPWEIIAKREATGRYRIQPAQRITLTMPLTERYALRAVATLLDPMGREWLEPDEFPDEVKASLP